MERIGSPEMDRGFRTGTCGGITMRAIGEGGAQERQLANKYRSWAKQRTFSYPRVGALLERIADTYARQAAQEDDDAKVKARRGF